MNEMDDVARRPGSRCDLLVSSQNDFLYEKAGILKAFLLTIVLRIQYGILREMFILVWKNAFSMDSAYHQIFATSAVVSIRTRPPTCTSKEVTRASFSVWYRTIPSDRRMREV
jgi:hypothetical protein